MIYIENRLFEKAKAVLEPVLELEPNNIELLNSLGIVYRGTNEPEKAIEFYRKVLELSDDDPVSLLNISIIQAEHLKKYPEAIATIEEYLSKGKKEKALALQWKKEYQVAFEEQEAKRKEQELREALLKKARERQAARGGSSDSGDTGDSDTAESQEKSEKTETEEKVEGTEDDTGSDTEESDEVPEEKVEESEDDTGSDTEESDEVPEEKVEEKTEEKVEESEDDTGSDTEESDEVLEEKEEKTEEKVEEKMILAVTQKNRTKF